MALDQHELLKQEINEVKLLLEGIASYNQLPEPILDLTINKVDRLKSILVSMKNGSVPSSPASSTPTGARVVETSVKEEPIAAPILEEQQEIIEEPVLPEVEVVQEEKTEKVISEEIPPAQTEEPVVEEEIITERHDEEFEPTVEEEFQEEVAEEDPEIKVEPVEPVNNEVVEAPVEVKPSQPIKKESVADRLSAEKRVVNDGFGEEKGSLAQKIGSTPIANIKRAIPINDRFRFQRDLFGNNVQEFNQTLDHLESLTDLNEALTFLQHNFDWDLENSTVNEFMVLVHRRFMK